jgi:putative membrane protein
MVRFLSATAIELLASAIGLLVAAWLLDDMTITGAAFIIAVAIFTLSTAILNPFIVKMAMRHAQAILGATALVTTFVGLVITAWLTDGLSITGADTWLFATLIVWAASMIAAMIIPMFILKRGAQNVREHRMG